MNPIMIPASHYSSSVATVSKLLALAVVLLVGTTVTQAATELYFIHNDHLGTPQVITDQNQTVVWQGDKEPFGETTTAIEAIQEDSRFPGQYYDSETGYHYNYYRDYDSSTGRYIQSDTIGLIGGINTYGYAGQNPYKYVDPDGRVFFLPFIFAIVGAGGTSTTVTVGTGLGLALAGAYIIGQNNINSISGDEDDWVSPFDDLETDPFETPPEDVNEEKRKDRDHCTRIYERCVNEAWGGDWSCGACQTYCTGINGVWPFEHCSEDLGCR